MLKLSESRHCAYPKGTIDNLKTAKGTFQLLQAYETYGFEKLRFHHQHERGTPAERSNRRVVLIEELESLLERVGFNKIERCHFGNSRAEVNKTLSWRDRSALTVTFSIQMTKKVSTFRHGTTSMCSGAIGFF